MSIVDGVGLIEWEGGLFTPDSALLPRVRWAFTQIRAEGGSISLNEAGRPFGVYSDRYVTDSSQTASGLSTVNYQWGRYLRGETPSAANPAGGPYASEHTQGIAIDCNASQPSLRAKYFAMVGLQNTIASESWHWAIRGPSTVDLTDYQWAGQNYTPIETAEQREERELMGAKDEIVTDVVKQVGELIKAATRGNVVVYWNKDTGRTYSVAPNFVKHHASDLERDSAYRQSGQESTRLAIGATTEELKIVFYNNGLEEFAGKIIGHPEGFTFEPGAKITW